MFKIFEEDKRKEMTATEAEHLYPNSQFILINPSDDIDNPIGTLYSISDREGKSEQLDESKYLAMMRIDYIIWGSYI